MSRRDPQQRGRRSHWRRAARPLASAVLIVAAVATALAHDGGSGGRDDDRDDDGRDGRGAYAIGLWGDLPYSTLQATVGVPNLIADMNRQDLAFTVQDGDLKAGSGTPCDDALYTQALGFLNSLKAPAAHPGDNTD